MEKAKLALLERIHERLVKEKFPSDDTNIALSKIFSHAIQGMDDHEAIEFLAGALAIEAWSLICAKREQGVLN